MDTEQLRASAAREGIYCEFYPDFRLAPEDGPLTWLEVTLHADLADGGGRATFGTLRNVAAFLSDQVQRHTPSIADAPLEYYTLHPRPGNEPRLSRSLSFVVRSAIEGPGAALALRAALRPHLAWLGIRDRALEDLCV